MFDLESEIQAWRENLARQKVGDGEILDELESHLREEFDRLRAVELSDTARFQFSAATIGNVRELKKEYRRLRWRRFWNLHNTPLTVKILAAWFIFRGADAVLAFPHFVLGGTLTLKPIIMHSLFVLQIPLGIGLLRLRNKWRLYGLVWSAYFLASFSYAKLFVTLYRPVIPPGMSVVVRGLFFGIHVPLSLADIFVYVNAAVLVWGCYILIQPSARNFFRPANASQIST